MSAAQERDSCEIVSPANGSRPDLRGLDGGLAEPGDQHSLDVEAFKAVEWWPDHRANPLDLLTDAEMAVAGLLSLALRNKDIASRLDISGHKVKSHLSNVLKKFTLDNRTQVAIEARRAGIFRRAIEEAGSDTGQGRLGPVFDLMHGVRFGEEHQVLPRSVLTQLEMDVFIPLTHGGMPNADIVDVLIVSEQTVKLRLTNTYRKLGTSDRDELAFIAAFDRVGIAAKPPEAQR